jgi:putative FmdB family regulatory protein
MTYEYECTDLPCRHLWEAEQRITETPLKVCPACGKETAKRLISQGNFVLNGTGWEKKGGY